MTETGVDATAFETFVRGDLFRAILRTQHADLFAGTTVGTGTVPTGTITPYAGTLAPESWLLCSGQTVLRSQYSDLYAVISNRFGGVTDGTTVRLPDLRGRVPVGAGTGTGGGVAGVGAPAGGVALTARALGAYAGDERFHKHSHTITDPGHGHTVTDPGHDHRSYTTINGDWVGISTGYGEGGWAVSDYPAYNNNTSHIGAASNTTGITVGGVNPSNTTGITVNDNSQNGLSENVQPSVVLNYIIRT